MNSDRQDNSNTGTGSDLHTDRYLPDWFQATIENLVDAVLIFNGANILVAHNQAACNLLGYSAEVLLGLPAFNLFEGEIPWQVQDVGNSLAQALLKIAAEMRTRNGDSIRTELWIQQLLIEGKSFVHVILRPANDRPSREVARQRLLEQQLAVNRLALALGESTELATIYRVIFDHVKMLMDAETFIVSFYDKKEQLIRAGYIVGPRGVLDVTSFPPIPLEQEGHGTQSQVIYRGEPVYLPDLKNALRKTATAYTFKSEDGSISGGAPLQLSERQISQSALYVPMKIRGEPIGVMQVQSYRLDAYARDDIELLSALANVAAVAIQNARLFDMTREQALQVSQIINTVPEGVLLLDSDLSIILANPVAQGYLTFLTDAKEGDKLSELAERTMTELLNPPTTGLWHQLEEGGRAFEVISQPLESEPGDEGWVFVIREVTREREIQERVQRQDRLAAVGQLAAGVAHDFNNIAAAIILFAQLTERVVDMNPKVERYLKTIQRQAGRASDLIQQILDFSRKAVLERQLIDLIPFVKELVKLLDRTLPENIRIELNHEPGELTIDVDPTRLQQIIMNLAVNARDAMPVGGTLKIDMVRIPVNPGVTPPLPEMDPTIEAWIRIAVSDDGTGIPADILPRLFEPFFTTKEVGMGTGLGLSQVYGIVKQHDGEIDVQSNVGIGTTFTIYFPAVQKEQRVFSSSAEIRYRTGAKETILVVEDDPNTRDAMLESLEVLDYQVLSASNGREALATYNQHRQDIALVLTDLVMPELGGKALIRALRQQGAKVKIVIMTGHPMPDDGESLRETGATAWFQKPIKLEQLAEVIAQALGRDDG